MKNLWGDVIRGAEDGKHIRLAFKDFAESKIDQLDRRVFPIRVEHEVLEFEVPVRNAPLVTICHGLGGESRLLSGQGAGKIWLNGGGLR